MILVKLWQTIIHRYDPRDDPYVQKMRVDRLTAKRQRQASQREIRRLKRDATERMMLGRD